MVFDLRYEIRLNQAIAELNRAGARVTDVSPEDRREARRLEKEMSQAAGGGDFERFDVLVATWRDLILQGCTRTQVVFSRVLGREIALRRAGSKVIHIEEVPE